MVDPSDEAPERSPLSRPWVWIAAAALVSAAAVVGVVRQRAPAELPMLGSLAPFSLVNHDAQPFGSEQLRGQAWVANFIFTRCPTVCPPITKKMAALQERARGLEGSLRLVTFSVDPDFDQPPVLRAYMEKNGADPRLWTFLTGNYDALKETVVGGLKQAMGRIGPADDLNAVFHGTHFVLVDSQLQIRGYYASSDPAAMERLAVDMRELAQHGP